MEEHKHVKYMVIIADEFPTRALFKTILGNGSYKTSAKANHQRKS